MVRGRRDLTMPDLDTLNSYIERTEALLKELHESLNEPGKAEMLKALAAHGKGQDVNPFTSAAVMREPIFYGAESAYGFQYRDLSVEKYARDEAWLVQHKNFKPADARKIVATLGDLLNEHLLANLQALKNLPPEEWSVLAGFQFTSTDLAAKAHLPEATVKYVIDAFTCPEDGNPTFIALNEFNAANAFPILKGDGDERILFLYASLTEALYDTPFYWMNGDKAYAAVAARNRGTFTEEFSAARLARVFGVNRVFRNVDIWESSSRKNRIGEIDALVLIGDRAVVVQAKSKKLTLAARKGNDLHLQADFKAAVQDACDQAVTCSRHLLTGISFLTDSSGREIALPGVLKKIHPICVVSDHYPALSFQAQQFLAFKASHCVENPIVCDVFFIDVVTEFLDTPLRFLSYLELRAGAANNVLLSHEIVALGFHLRQNLWLGEYDFIALQDDIAVDVDIAMAARRDGVDGERTPPGILTQLKGTAVGRIIEEIENRSEPGAIGVGLELLKLSGQSARALSDVIDKIAAAAGKDRKTHDATLAVGQGASGITVHSNWLPDTDAIAELQRHCKLRKYSARASTWFGLAIGPGDGEVRFGLMLDYPWEQDPALDAVTTPMPAQTPMRAVKKFLERTARRKVGRNDLCPCGSGIKYKNCHLTKGGLP